MTPSMALIALALGWFVGPAILAGAWMLLARILPRRAPKPELSSMIGKDHVNDPTSIYYPARPEDMRWLP